MTIANLMDQAVIDCKHIYVRGSETFIVEPGKSWGLLIDNGDVIGSASLQTQFYTRIN